VAEGERREDDESRDDDRERDEGDERDESRDDDGDSGSSDESGEDGSGSDDEKSDTNSDDEGSDDKDSDDEKSDKSSDDDRDSDDDKSDESSKDDESDDDRDSDEDDSGDGRETRGAGQDEDVEREGKAEKPPEEDESREEEDEDEGEEEEKRLTPVKGVFLGLGIVVLLVLGLFFFVGVIAPTWLTGIIIAVVWFALTWFLLRRFTRNRPHLRGLVFATFFAIVAIALLGFLWTTLRSEEVHEKVVTGVKASQVQPTAKVPEAPEEKPPEQNLEVSAGDIHPADETSASGRAAYVQLPGNEVKLTFSDLDMTNGWDLRVYLVPGDGTSTKDRYDLGPLKGNKGDQQYDIPRDADIKKYRNVVIWSRPFGIPYARAAMKQQ
jgi:hypothetical protein